MNEHPNARIDKLEDSDVRLWNTMDDIRDSLKEIAVSTACLPKLVEEVREHGVRISALEKREQYRNGKLAAAWFVCTTFIAVLVAWITKGIGGRS